MSWRKEFGRGSSECEGTLRGARSTFCSLVMVFVATSCSSGGGPIAPEFRDPLRGSVPALRDAAISVLVLPGNGYGGAAESTDGLEGVECVLWSSGDVVWSAGVSPGAAPHRHGRVPPERVTSLAAELGAQIDGTTQRTFAIPDASHEQMCVRSDGREFVLLSCHELFEANVGLVATEHGVVVLDGRTRDGVLAGEPAEFLTFRRTWREVRAALRVALPKAGELVDRAKLSTLGVR